MDSRPSFVVVFLILLVSGCQNGGQQDLVVRELRMQEDQLYAMENYLSEYQQLVCKYRSENAALRRQLVDRSDEGELPAPQDQSAPGSRGDGPSLQTPESTPQQQQQQNAAPAPGGIEEPSVPPLETTPSSSPPPIDAALYIERPGEVVAAAGQATIKGLTPIEPTLTDARHPDHERTHGVSLRGEVLANEDNGGPRLAVDVEPFNLSDGPVQFEGILSLMLLVPDSSNEPQNLARWDFSAEEVQAAIETAGEPAMRFYLELPANAELTKPSELWVRLLPLDGGKLLTHAEINLAQLGGFSSNNEIRNQATRDDSLQLASFDSSPSETSPIPSMKLTGDWTIARPGEPAGVKTDSSSASEWRASSEPIPVVVQTPSRASRAADSVRSATTPDKATSPLLPLYKRPTWTAERPGTSGTGLATAVPQSASRPQRPSWSATR